MELKAASDRRSIAHAARSSDGSRALREQMMALAGIASGAFSAASHAAKAGELDQLDQRALEQGSYYFAQRAEDAKKGKPSSSLSTMAAMGAASEFAALAEPKIASDNEKEAKFFLDVATWMNLLRQDPRRRDVANELIRLFNGVSDAVRAEARSLVYQDIDRSRSR